MERTYRIGDYALLLLLAVIFASNFIMTKVVVDVLPPMFFVSFRLAIAAVFLTGVMVLAGRWFPKGRIWSVLLASAFFGHTVPFSLLAWGQQGINAGLAAILVAIMPLFTLLLAQIFTDDEKPNRYSIAGFTIALAGIVILFGPEKLASLADQSLRQYAVILAAMSYGVNAIVTKSLTALPWQQSTAAFMVAAFVFSLPMLILSDLSSISAPWHVWMAGIYSGIVPTGIGAVMIVFLVRRAGASFLSQINFLVPVIGVVFSIAFLGEVLPPGALLALAIILAGVAIARRRPKRKLISINKGV